MVLGHSQQAAHRFAVAAVAADDDAIKVEDIEVEPSVMTWARTSIGLDEERAAKTIGVVVGTPRKWRRDLSGAAAG